MYIVPERNYNLRDLQAIASGGAVRLLSPRGEANFTHWSFGQLSRTVGAPAAYLRELPAPLAAQCLNHGISRASVGVQATLLVQAPNGKPEPTIRACTSDSYGRVWDAELYGAVLQIIDGAAGWTCEQATRSDRDSSVTLTNKAATLQDPSVRAIVNDPRADVGGIMYRSLTIGNSETGGSSVWWESGLFRARCKNLMLWTPTMERSGRRRHVGARVLRDAFREIATIARTYIHQSATRDEQIIRALIDRELAATKDAVIDELRAIGCTRAQVEQAYTRCEQTEACSPRSFWGAAQGLTRISQDSPYQDGRFELDQLAAKVLSRGARLVAA